jgi:hypothetical protein
MPEDVEALQLGSKPRCKMQVGEVNNTIILMEFTLVLSKAIKFTYSRKMNYSWGEDTILVGDDCYLMCFD